MKEMMKNIYTYKIQKKQYGKYWRSFCLCHSIQIALKHTWLALKLCFSFSKLMQLIYLSPKKPMSNENKKKRKQKISLYESISFKCKFTSNTKSIIPWFWVVTKYWLEEKIFLLMWLFYENSIDWNWLRYTLLHFVLLTIWFCL